MKSSKLLAICYGEEKGAILRSRLTMLLSALLVLVLIGIGCGGDDNPESNGAGGTDAGAKATQGGDQTDQAAVSEAQGNEEPTIATSSLSKEEFVKRANAICAKKAANYSDEIGSFLKSPGNQASAEQVVFLKGVKAVVLPINEAQVAAIRQLGAPEGDEEELEAALIAQEEAVRELRQTKRIQSVSEPRGQFSAATEMLNDYGLKNCVFSP